MENSKKTGDEKRNDDPCDDWTQGPIPPVKKDKEEKQK